MWSPTRCWESTPLALTGGPAQRLLRSGTAHWVIQIAAIVGRSERDRRHEAFTSSIRVSSNGCGRSHEPLADRMGRKLPNTICSHDRTICARRTSRCAYAADRTEAYPELGSAVLCGEPGGRWWKPWHGGRSAGGPRRLYGYGCQHELPRQSKPLSQNSLRPAQGLCAGHVGCCLSECADDPPVNPSEQCHRADRVSQGKPGKVQFRPRWQGHHTATFWRNVQAVARARHCGRGFQRFSSGDPVRAWRPHTNRLHCSHTSSSSDKGRAAACSSGYNAEAFTRSS